MLNSNRRSRSLTLLPLAFFLKLFLIVMWLTCLLSPLAPAATASPALRFDARQALAYTRKAVSFGERPSGSEQMVKLRDWIVAELRPLGGELTLDSFTAETPAGPIPMANIILKFPGKSGRSVVVSGHYDTKRMPLVHFVGANDGGSSTGFLMEFARVASRMSHPDDLYIVFFDGEEAIGNWSDTDSRYGSRHLAAKWLSENKLSQIRALINVDMIGDQNLDLADDENSSQELRERVWRIAARLGDAKYFRRDPTAIDDDHKPFADLGVNVIDIIDLDYGPNGSYWHTAQDTLDKLSVHSFEVVGDVVTALVEELEQSK